MININVGQNFIVFKNTSDVGKITSMEKQKKLKKRISRQSFKFVKKNGNIVKDITNQLIHVTSDINRYFFNTNFIFIDRCEDLVGSIIKVFISTFASIK